MDALEIAIHNAENGWPMFFVQENKVPFPGFDRWEERATTSPTTLDMYWNGHGLPAVAPGRVDKTVIDVDRKPGKPNGYESLVNENVDISDNVFRAVSLNGKGLHYYFRGLTSSINHLMPSVDRKSRGGYIVTPYKLPPVTSVKTKLPIRLQGSRLPDIKRERPYGGSIADWLSDCAGLTPSRELTTFITQFKSDESFRGHEALLNAQTHVVLLAGEGHGGVPEALDTLRGLWINSDHRSGDPAQEWHTALTGAIRKFGGTKQHGR